MKKLIAIAATALTMGAFADSYLYWMLNTGLSWSGENSSSVSYNTVKIGVMNNTTGENVGYLNLYSEAANSLGTSISGVSSEFQTSAYALIGDKTTGYSYYIELLNDTVFVGRSSDVLNYAAIAEYSTSSLNGVAMPGKAWAPTSFTTAAIPEPTSGLLMLFGLSALALRRKRPLKA